MAEELLEHREEMPNYHREEMPRMPERDDLWRPKSLRQAWGDVIKEGRGFMEGINSTLQELVNPVSQEGQIRAAADVAGVVAGGGVTAALRRPGASLGISGGRLPPPRKTRDIPLQTEKGEDYLIRQNPDRQSEWAFHYKGKDVGGFEIRADSVPGQVTIDALKSTAPGGTGLSRPAYAHFRELYEQVGQRLVPSETMTQASYNNWKRMDPELLAKGNYKLKDGIWYRDKVDFSKVLVQ